LLKFVKNNKNKGKKMKLEQIDNGFDDNYLIKTKVNNKNSYLLYNCDEGTFKKLNEKKVMEFIDYIMVPTIKDGAMYELMKIIQYKKKRSDIPITILAEQDNYFLLKEALKHSPIVSEINYNLYNKSKLPIKKILKEHNIELFKTDNYKNSFGLCITNTLDSDTIIITGETKPYKPIEWLWNYIKENYEGPIKIKHDKSILSYYIDELEDIYTEEFMSKIRQGLKKI